MQPIMGITDTDRNLLSQALAMAASRYVELAAEAETLDGGKRIAEQFRRQAIDARTYAILLGDADTISIVGAGDRVAAHEDARRVVAREVIDSIQHKKSPAVAADAHARSLMDELNRIGNAQDEAEEYLTRALTTYFHQKCILAETASQ